MLPTTFIFRVFLLLLLPLTLGLTLGAAIPRANHSPNLHLPQNRLRSYQNNDDLPVRQAWLIKQAQVLRSKYASYLDGKSKDLYDQEHKGKVKTEDPKPHL
ncbi:hypothetical protein I352_02542 [Cryptococcus deuterogattii MMRL2647]|nr:hypothetical protein I352_02542 [Cryptococcus deuterogattii MMRL2647]